MLKETPAPPLYSVNTKGGKKRGRKKCIIEKPKNPNHRVDRPSFLSRYINGAQKREKRQRRREGKG